MVIIISLILFFCWLTCVFLTELACSCRLKDKYHPTNLLTVIERCALFTLLRNCFFCAVFKLKEFCRSKIIFGSVHLVG